MRRVGWQALRPRLKESSESAPARNSTVICLNATWSGQGMYCCYFPLQRQGRLSPGVVSLATYSKPGYSSRSASESAKPRVRFAPVKANPVFAEATAPPLRAGDVSAVEERLSALEDKAEETFPTLAASLAVRRGSQSESCFSAPRHSVFADPSGVQVPLVRHCSLKETDTQQSSEALESDSSRRAPRQGVQGFAGGDLHRDVLLLPPSATCVGLMIRRLALELQVQLQRFSDQQKRLWEGHSASACKDKTERDADAAGRCSAEFQCSAKSKQRGFLLDGHRGVGKSQILNYLVAWAREQGWLVVFEPLPSMYAKGIGDIRRSVAGVYIQCDFARTFLERLCLFNGHLLERISVNMATYGNAALDGVHRRLASRAFESLLEATVAEDLDDVRKQICSAEEGDWNHDKGFPLLLTERRQAITVTPHLPSVVKPGVECRTRLPSPKSLLDIANFGAENEAHATQACYEIMEQLKKQTTFNLLVVVDQWNSCFPVSEYLSMRYENTKFGGRIPAYHLAIPRLLSFFDGGAYRRGMKIVATSWSDMRRRDFKPELLGVRSEEIRTVRNFSPLEFASYVDYLQAKRAIHGFDPDQLNYYYMMTGKVQDLNIPVIPSSAASPGNSFRTFSGSELISFVMRMGLWDDPLQGATALRPVVSSLLCTDVRR